MRYMARSTDWLDIGQKMANADIVALLPVQGEGMTVNNSALLGIAARKMSGHLEGGSTAWAARWGPGARGQTAVREGRTRAVLYTFGYGTSDPTAHFMPQVTPGSAAVLVWAPRGNGSGLVYRWSSQRWQAIGQLKGIKAPAGASWRALRAGVPQAGQPGIPGPGPGGEPAKGPGGDTYREPERAGFELPQAMPALAVPIAIALFLVSR